MKIYGTLKSEVMQMKILIVPDSFKGSMSSKQVCKCIASAIESVDKSVEITAVPFSDGGEGFADCMHSICNGNTLYTQCRNIYTQPVDVNIITFTDTAVIECAQTSGLLSRKNVMQATSYGTGEAIIFACLQGYRHIILGLGGTGCCDGGAGALSALGAKFFDENYNEILYPKGQDLNYIFGADFRNVVKDICFTYACDVENEYFGNNGAAYVFAKQKGARDTDLPLLDEGLKRLNAFFKKDISTVKGAGAAGGICGGLYAVYGGEIKSGFDILCEYAGLEEKIKSCDAVITGEGRTDAQTLMGKLPYKIAQLAKMHGKRCVLISGKIENVKLGDIMLSLVDETTDEKTAIHNAEEILSRKAKTILKYLK